MSDELYIFPQNQSGLLIYLSLLGEANFINKFFTLEKLSWYASYFWTAKIFIEHYQLLKLCMIYFLLLKTFLYFLVMKVW